MTKLNSYLNFQGNAEEAFDFYKSVFGGDHYYIMRFKDVAEFPGKEKLSEQDLNKVMHVSLKIGDNMLMATDMLEAFGQKLKTGNNSTLSLHPDTKEEADRLYTALSRDGQPLSPMAETFWGYWGMLIDKFGVQWMVNLEKA
jgi:PhnB protein